MKTQNKKTRKQENKKILTCGPDDDGRKEKIEKLLAAGSGAN